MMPESSDRPRTRILTTQLILGLAVIVAGVLLTLDNLDILEAQRYLPFWPVVILAIGLVHLLTERQAPQRAIGGFLTFIGALLLLGVWAGVPVRFRDLWPLLLIFWGGMIVLRGWYGRLDRRPTTTDDRGVFNVVAFLSGFDRVVSGEPFQGGDVSAFMGGGKLDLTRAQMADGASAVVNVSALMGGMEIRIPEEWAAENRIVYFMGGSNDRSRRPTSPTPPRLVLKGFVMMGSVEIKN